MAESEFKIKVGVDINPAGIQKQLNSIKGNKLKIDIDTTAANNKINALKKNIESLAKIQVKIGGFGVASTGNLNFSNGYAKEIKNASAAFKELQAIQRQIKANMYSISLFDADKDKAEIKELEATIESLMSEYNKLYNIKNKSLKPIEKAALDRDFNAEISGTKQVTEAYKQLAKASREIGKIKIKIAGLDGVTDANQIETYKRQLEELEATYNRLKASLVQNMSETQFGKLSADVTDTMNKLDQLNARLLDAKTKAANKISSDIGVGDFDNDISKLEYSYRRINNANEDLINSMERLRNASENLNISNNDFLNADNEEDRLVAMDKLISAEKEFADAKRVTKNQIDDNTRSQKEQEEVARATAKSMKELTAQQKLRADADKLSSKMDLWLHNNSAAAADFGDSIHSLQNELKKCDAVRFQGIKNEFDQITTKARILGKTGLNFTDRLKMQFTRLSSYFSVATVMMAAMQKGREAFQNVLEVDTALTGLYRVTDLTTSQYDSLYDGMTASAKEYGVVLTDLINATADWSRAGFAPDVASELAEVTAIYQHISDLDYDTASENLLTAYKGFEDDLNKTFSGDSVAAVGYIGDILNELDNEFAVTAAGLGEGIKRSASALQVAGNTIQETAAMIGGITEVTQDPEKAGNALKVVSMRLRGMKGELQELGEETDENVENLSKMQGDILNLTHGKVNIFDARGEFKSTYDILDSVADVWDRLSTIEQADLLETMAGKHRANDLAAILSNWENVEAMYESAMGAEGSAEREHEKYVKSMQGRLDSLSSSWQALSNTILGSDFLGGIISGFGGALDAIDAFIDKFGLFPTLLSTASSVMSVKGKGFFRLIEDESTISGYRVGTMFGNSIWKSLSNIGNKIGGLFRGEFGNNLTSSAFKFDDGIVQQLKSDTQALNDLRMALGNTDVLLPEAVADSMQNASDATKKWAEDINLANMSNEKALQVINERQDSLQSLAVTQQAQNKSLLSSRKLLAEYNSGMKTTGMSQQAFVDAVNKGNPAMGKYLSSVSIGKASMSGYIVSLVGARVATIALEAATMALNMAMTMGIGVAIGAVITGISSLINHYDDLAESVDESSNAFNESNSSLMKNAKGFKEAANEYDKLRHGVNSVGENIGLSVDEFDRYHDAVNKIAELVPSMVSGFDSQGNAILNNVSSVNELTDAYAELIASESKAFIEGDEEKGYVGAKKVAEDYIHEMNSATDVKIHKYDKAENDLLKELIDGTKSVDDLKDSEIHDISKKLGLELESGGFWGTADYEKSADNLEKYIKENVSEMKQLVGEYDSEYQSIANSMKDTATAFLNTELYNKDNPIFDASDSIKNSLSQYVGNLDQDFFEGIYNEAGGNADKAVELLESKISGVVAKFAEMNASQQKQLEDAFTLKSDFDSGDIGAKEFADKVAEVDKMLDDLGLDSDEKKQFMVSLGFEYDDDGKLKSFTKEYEDALARFGGDKASNEIKGWLGSLSGGDLDIVANMELKGDESIDRLKELLELEKALQGLSTIDINIESDSLAKLNEAVTASNSATGLNTEQIDAVKSRYADLDSFDPAGLFEKTTTGVRLNTKALQALEKEYINTKKAANEQSIATMAAEMKRLEGLNASGEHDAEIEGLRERIEEAQMAAAAYDGLTSSYNNWLNAQSGGQEGDRYDSILEGRENAQKLANEGKWGNTELQGYVEMFTSPDVALDTPQQYADAWAGAVRRSNRYFQEGKQGINNFLSDVHKANSDLVKINEDGSFEIQPGFDTEQWAKASKMAESSVEAMFGMMSEYGVDVPIGIEEMSVDELVKQSNDAAKKASDALKSSMGEDFEIEVKTDVKNVDEANAEIERLKAQRDEINNSDATVEVKQQGVDAVNSSIESVIMQKIELEQPAFMKLDASQVKSTMVEALGALQQYQTAANEVTKLEGLQGAGVEIDTSQLDAAKAKVDETAQAIANLPEEVKVAIGLDGDDGVDAVKKKIADDKVTLTVDTSASASATEHLVSTMEKIEDKNVTITVTIDGIKDVETLEKALNLTANIDGGIEDLTSFVSVAKEAAKLDDSISKIVTATISGNVGEGKNLYFIKEFSKVVAELGGASNVSISVKADVQKFTSDELENLRQFANVVNNLHSANISVNINADPTSISSIQTALENLAVSGVMTDYKATVTVTANNNLGDGFEGTGTATMKADPENFGDIFKGTGTVSMKPKTTHFTGFTGSGSVTLKANVTGLPSNVTATVSHGGGGGAFANGTAFANGNWSTKDSGTALMGELGRETIVRDGRYFTVGDNGAEFVKYQKGDIIFNHKQTEELFKNGCVTSGGGRGRAFVEGTAFANVGGGTWKPGGIKPGGGVSSGSSKSTKSSPSKNAEKEAEKFEEVIDWIEVALDRIERAIKNLDTVASSVFRSWTERTSALNKQIAETRNEIDLQQRGYDRYMKAASETGLSSDWVNKIQNGKVDIELVTDENLKEKIDQYQEW